MKCNLDVLNAASVEFTIVDGGLELFGNSQLDKIAIRTRDEDVDLVRLGGDNLGIEAVLGEDDLNAAALVNGEGRNATLALDLNTVAVDKLNDSDSIVEDNTALVAVINADTVDLLALNVDDSVVVLVKVDGLLGLGIVDGKVGIVLELAHPLVSFEFELGSSLLDGLLGTSANGGLLDGHNRAAVVGVSVLGLHVLGDLLETRGNIGTLVDLREQGVHVSSSSSRGSNGGRRRRSTGRGSGGSSGRGSTNVGRGGLTTLLPDKTGSVVLLDESNQGGEETLEGVDPVDLVLVLGLVLSQHLVGVELRVPLEFSDEGAGGGGNSDPTKSGGNLRKGREVVPLGVTTVGVTKGDDLTNTLSSGLQRLGKSGIVRLVTLGSNVQELAVGLEGSLERSNLGLEFSVSDLLGKFNEFGDVLVEERVELSNPGSARGSRRGSTS